MPIQHNQSWDSEGNLIHEEWVDQPYMPLSGYQLIAALNACLSIWTLEEASNISGVSEEHLVAEVEAWGAFL